MAHPYDDRYRDEYHRQREYGRGDRGFLERAGDEVRSWFGHDDAQRRRRHDEEAARRERVTSEHGSTGGEQEHGPERWGDDLDRWRGEPDRWRADAGRGERDMGRDYARSSRTWNEPGYGRWTNERSMQENRWRAGEESRDYGDRWERERGGTWGPSTSSQEGWRRESGADYGDRGRESRWGSWPREEGPREEASWAGQRRMGESRGYYEDEGGLTHQFAHGESARGAGRGMGAGVNYAGRGPKNYRRSDDRIREEICDRLTDDWRIDATDVEVIVNNGQVTLGGSVHSREEKRKAEDLVESVPGVHDVHNTLRVSQWDDTRYGGATGAGAPTGGTASTPGSTAATPHPNPANANPANASGTRR